MRIKRNERNIEGDRTAIAIQKTASNQHFYPWISPCGIEKNYLRQEEEESIIVYWELRRVNDDKRQGLGVSTADQPTETHVLVWAGSRTTPFNPNLIKYGSINGRFYYPYPKEMQHLLDEEHPFALLSTAIALEILLPRLEETDDGFFLEWNQKYYNLLILSK
jgi:hypothetical protein